MRITIERELRRCPYPRKKLLLKLMECGQRMQQGQGQGIHRIEYLYCGVTRTCPRETQGTGIGTGPDYPETDPETCFRERRTEMHTLLGIMQDGIKEMETLTGIDCSPVTINRYKNVVKKLQRLIPLLLRQGGYHLP